MSTPPHLELHPGFVYSGEEKAGVYNSIEYARAYIGNVMKMMMTRKGSCRTIVAKTLIPISIPDY